LAFGHEVLWATDAGRRIHRQHLTHNQPVHQHADRCQMQLHGGGTSHFRELLDVSCNDEWSDLRQRDAVPFAPAAEACYSPPVGDPRPRIADVSGEELDEPPLGPLSRLPDQRRYWGSRKEVFRGPMSAWLQNVEMPV